MGPHTLPLRCHAPAKQTAGGCGRPMRSVPAEVPHTRRPLHRRSPMRLRYFVLASVLGLALTVPAAAQTTYSCFLNSTNEVPVNVSPALGSCVAVVNAAGTQVSITCQFVGLVGTYTASHLHGPAAPGVNAGVQIGFVGLPAGWVFSNSNHDGTLTNYLAPIS